MNTISANRVETAPWVNEAWEQTVNKVKRTSARIGAEFPHASQAGTYVLEAPHWWTAGFGQDCFGSFMKGKVVRIQRSVLLRKNVNESWMKYWTAMIGWIMISVLCGR